MENNKMVDPYNTCILLQVEHSSFTNKKGYFDVP